jgi:hypothetical protein
MKRLFFLLLLGMVVVRAANAQGDDDGLTCADEETSNTLAWVIEHLGEVQYADATTQYQALADVQSRLQALENACGGRDVPVSADYQPAFGIDYAHPELYLVQGTQSQITDPSVLDDLRTDARSLAHLEEIFHWLKSDFTHYGARGQTIGVVTVDDLLANRRLGGCHDFGLVYAALARELGYPAVMVRTVSVAWIKQYQADKYESFIGHVFVEVFLDGKWILIDSTNGYFVTDGYDPTNPVIPLKENITGTTEEIFGFLAERKGIDTWAFGIHSPAESNQAMRDFADRVDLETIQYPEYTFQRFSPARRP